MKTPREGVDRGKAHRSRMQSNMVKERGPSRKFDETIELRSISESIPSRRPDVRGVVSNCRTAPARPLAIGGSRAVRRAEEARPPVPTSVGARSSRKECRAKNERLRPLYRHPRHDCRWSAASEKVGPRGLMTKPEDWHGDDGVAPTVKGAKGGSVESGRDGRHRADGYRKASFTEQKVGRENVKALADAGRTRRSRPAPKGTHPARRGLSPMGTA